VAAFIASQRAEHQIPHATSCRALGMSQAWFYKWCHGDPSPQHARRQLLTVRIKQLFAAHRRKWGSPRITADLRDEGWSVSVNTVAAIMAEQGLRARTKRRRKQTTRPAKGHWQAPDLVCRNFGADQVIASGTATAPRSTPTKGSSTSTVSWTWRHGGSSGSR